MSEQRVTIHTDGACSGNPGPGGWGALLVVDDQQEELSGGIRQTRPFELKAEIRPGSWFIVGGQKAYVAEAGEIFNSAMTGFSAQSTAAVAATYDFSRVTAIVDVGGGLGTLMATLLKKYPQMNGVLVDRPHVIADARSFLEAEGVAQRCELVSGNFFEVVPSGGDAYILQNIIHDWDDERATAILKSCRRAISANGKLLLSEMVIPPDNRPYFGTVFDLEMQVLCGSGRERTESEFRALFEAAGFKLTRVIPAPSYSYVIEGVPV